MTTAARGTRDEDEILTMDPVEPERRFGDSALARWLFIVLAIVAALALVAAILVIVMAPTKAALFLTIALGTLVVVVIAEIVLLLVAKPRKA